MSVIHQYLVVVLNLYRVQIMRFRHNDITNDRKSMASTLNTESH